MKRSVSRGSRPSRPRKISRRILAFRNPCLRRASAQAMRNGQIRNEQAVKKSEAMRLRKEPRNAKPAPGPMYAKNTDITNPIVAELRLVGQAIRLPLR